MLETIKVGFKKEVPEATIPKIAYNGESACFDLVALVDTVIPARGSIRVEHGLRFVIPEGYALEFCDRSSNAMRKQLQIHQGIVDRGYTGEMSILVFNMSDKDQTIQKGKGICQARLYKTPKYECYEVTEKEWEEYVKKSLRKENKWGSSDGNNKEKAVKSNLAETERGLI